MSMLITSKSIAVNIAPSHFIICSSYEASLILMGFDDKVQSLLHSLGSQ